MSELMTIVKQEKELKTLSEEMKNLPIQMVNFTLVLRGLYNAYQLSRTSETEMFLDILSETRRDSFVYVQKILPVAREVVSHLSQYMDFFLDLDYDDWANNLEDILEIVKDGLVACKLSRAQHEILITGLKARHDKAELAVTKTKQLCAEYRKKMEELVQNASDNKKTADIYARLAYSLSVLGLVVGVGVAVATANVGVGRLVVAGSAAAGSGISAGLMKHHVHASENNTAEAVAKLANADIAEKVAVLTQEELIPALASFIGGIQTFAKFFECQELELEKMVRLGDRGMENPKKLYFNMMKKNASRLNADCKQFYACLSDVRTNIAAIPEEPSDQNYVDQWLEKTKQEIRKKYRVEDANKMLSFRKNGMKAIKGSEESN